MGGQLSWTKIIGVALVLFSSILLGVGIHHVVSIGTCSSTGYSANYGPVPYCPSGTGAWFAFIFGGIIGCLVGSLMAGSFGLIFASIFGAIGFGSLSLLFDSTAKSGEKVFAAIFGGSFAIVGVIAAIAVLGSAIGSLRKSSTQSQPKYAPQPLAKVGAPAAAFAGGGDQTTQVRSAFGTPHASDAFGSTADPNDPIMGAYNASQGVTPTAPPPISGPPPVTPANLIPGLQAAQQRAGHESVEELAKLADMHAKGALTDAEFAAAKAKLLGRM